MKGWDKIGDELEARLAKKYQQLPEFLKKPDSKPLDGCKNFEEWMLKYWKAKGRTS